MARSFNSEKYRKSVIAFVICTVVIITSFLSFFYVKFMHNLTYKNVYNNITELSEQTATQLNLSIDNQMKFVQIVVDFINGGYANSIEQIFERFNPDLESYHFTRLVILDENGNGTTSDGNTVENYPNIQEFFQKEKVYLSENRPSTVSENQVNIYSKTFRFNGKKMVLFATINTENYKEILSRRLFNGKGGTYLINNKGEVLIDSFGIINDTKTNIYEYIKSSNQLTKEKETKKIDQMEKDIQEKKIGTLDITGNNKTYFIHYEKLKMNDWYVVTFAPDSTIAKELTTFLSISLGLCFLINFAVAGIFIYIYLSNQRKNRKIYEKAYIDPVTTLGNESYFKENASEFIQNSNKGKHVCILDINKFRTYNKLYSYEFCNKILKTFGELLEENLPKDNITCRISRDVFVTAFSYHGNVEKLLEKIFDKVKKISIDDIELNINISVGIYRVDPEDKDINKVLDKAYMSHSKIKGLYGNNYFIFDESLEEKFLEEQRIESEMEKAIKNDEFYVVYQPKVYASNEKLAGAEALVRWKKEKGPFPPSRFIPLFEKNRFIIKLDLYVFEKVCQDLAKWKEIYNEQPRVSVNVSKEHFVDEDFIEDYVKITDKYGVDRKKIDLEITESATVDESINVLKVFKKIKKKGFIISLDDFGTGYSSLNMLQDMPIDILKIDKLFVDNMDLKSNKNIINYIVFMAKELNVETIVEGVETKEQAEFIKKLKCDMIQGYYYAKPLLKEEFEEYLKK